MQVLKIVRYKDLRIKFLNTLIFIGIYRMGVFITLPYVNRSLLKNYLYSKDSMYDMVKILNTFSGGAIENASIFSLGIVPYITSSIIVSLFFTFFRRLKDKQENIQKNQGLFTFILALIISTFQSIIAAKYLKNLYFNSEPIVNNIEGINFFFICIITLTTGTIILIWISEKITKEGLGNGPSILIVTGILAKTPSSISYLYRGFIDLKYSISDIGAVFFFSFMALIVISIVELGERRISILLTSMHKRVYRYNNYLPIKVNFAGVMPPILASTLISLLLSITSPYLKYTLSNGHLLYQLIFSFLVVLFSYFYTINQLDLDSIVKNMTKLSIFIPNIRPGEKTKTYLREAIYRIILIGALYLICLCSFPIILQKILLNDIAFFFGGTTILLISTIIIDLVRKINNMLVMKRYLEFKHFWNYILSNTLKK